MPTWRSFFFLPVQDSVVSSFCASSYSIPDGALIEKQKHQEAKPYARSNIALPSDLGKLFNLFMYLDFSCLEYSYHKLPEEEVSSYGCIQLKSWSSTFWLKWLYSNVTIYASIWQELCIRLGS